MDLAKYFPTSFGTNPVDDFMKGHKAGAEVYDRDTLFELGKRAIKGDWQGAQNTAFERGKPDAGFKIHDWQQNQADDAEARQNRGREAEKKIALDTAGLFQNYIDKEPDPSKRTVMTRQVLAMHPNFGRRLQQFGIDANDPDRVSKFIQSEAQRYRTPEEVESDALTIERKRSLRDNSQRRASVEDEGVEYGIDETGKVVVLGDGADLPSTKTYSSTGGTNFGRTGQTADTVPGVVVTPKGAPSEFATREQQGQEATAKASAEAQQRAQKLRDIQRMWTQVYGKAPRAGHVYTEDGREASLAEGGPGTTLKFTSNTQAAAFGALHNSVEDLEIAREALVGKDASGSTIPEGGTNYATRGVSKLFNSGDFARAEKMMEPAVKAIMHGMSGASVGEAERQSYINTYMPVWNDSEDTINFKLDHMLKTISSIQGAIQSGSNEKLLQHIRDRAEIQNRMRKAFGLKEKHLPAAPGAPPQATGAESMSDEDLLKALGQ